LKVAAPRSTVDGLTVADRSVAAIGFFAATPQTVNPANGTPFLPGPLVDQGTSLLLGVPVTGLGIEAARTALVAAGQDLFVPVNFGGAFSTEEDEVVPPEGSEVLLRDFVNIPTSVDLRVTINGADLEDTLGVDLVDFRETYGDDPDDVEPTVRASIASDNGVLGGADLPLDPDVLSGPPFGFNPIYVGASFVADGQAFLAKDLPVGNHIIRVAGELDSNEDGVVDLSFETTFRIEVVRPITGSARGDRLFGTRGNDIVDGNRGNDRLFGQAGDDRLEGDKGNDALAGGRGDDVLLGGKGNDWACGGKGDDVLLLGAGGDRAFGSGGDDALLGEAGNDWLRGDLGDDTLAGGAGRDKLTGGSGSDTFQFAFGNGSDIVTDFDAGSDVIRFFGALFSGFASMDELIIESVGRHTRISYGNAADPEEVLLWQVDAVDLTDTNFLFS
jgi:Ca2+-binding RTX toxin-like protein